MTKVVPATKGGRCFNGMHNDSGLIVHFVPAMPDDVSGFWGDKSLCGSQPGYRGYGWVESYEDVNCVKCIKKYKSMYPVYKK